MRAAARRARAARIVGTLLTFTGNLLGRDGDAPGRSTDGTTRYGGPADTDEGDVDASPFGKNPPTTSIQPPPPTSR
jgi:hypothetical protein